LRCATNSTVVTRLWDSFEDDALVIPELQRRGLFRTEYEGKTLRENLGLPPVVHRYTAQRRASSQAAE
jgi:hypothetical protein